MFIWELEWLLIEADMLMEFGSPKQDCTLCDFVNGEAGFFNRCRCGFINDMMCPAAKDVSKSDVAQHCARPMQCDCSGLRCQPACQVFVLPYRISRLPSSSPMGEIQSPFCQCQ